MKNKEKNITPNKDNKGVIKESAKADFKKMMDEIQPFIKKSEIQIMHTEGKWFDTTSVSDTVILLCK